MITFKQFMEAAVKQWDIELIDVKKAVELLNAHCSKGIKAIETNGLLYRGFNHDHSVMVIDSSTGERTSKDTNNLYQLMMDTSSALKDYPKRSKSLICSSSIYEAGTYGAPMVIIPFDGTKVVYSDNDDFIYSRLDSQIVDDPEDIAEFTTALETVLSNIGLTKYAEGKEEQYTSAKEIDDAIAKDLDAFLAEWEDHFHDEGIHAIIKKNPKNVFTALSSIIMTPHSLRLDYEDFGTRTPRNVECWFSGKCVAMDARLFAGILNTLKAEGKKIGARTERDFIERYHERYSPKTMRQEVIDYIQDNLK